MLNKTRIALIVALLALPQLSLAADEPTGECVDVSAPKRAIVGRHGKWTELTPAQWQFQRGVYILYLDAGVDLEVRRAPPGTVVGGLGLGVDVRHVAAIQL